MAPRDRQTERHALPRAALLASWLGAWVRGEVSVDDLVAALEPLAHVVTGLPGSDGAEPLVLALGRLRALGTTGAAPAMPAPGDPVGLGGPASFNFLALEAGEALLLEGARLGLVPVTVGGAVEWRCLPAEQAPWIDLAEAAVSLRTTLLEVTRRLVDLDVATWQPEIPDALMNARHRRPPPLPPTYDARRVETVDRALLCLEVVRLARAVEPGAIGATEVEGRRSALAELDRAARRALVAACR